MLKYEANATNNVLMITFSILNEQYSLIDIPCNANNTHAAMHKVLNDTVDIATQLAIMMGLNKYLFKRYQHAIFSPLTFQPSNEVKILYPLQTIQSVFPLFFYASSQAANY